MEIKHKCKLCFKSFSNGRALGGHMRSHMVNLPIPSKATHDHSRHRHDDEDDDDDDRRRHRQQLDEELIESASMSSSASSSEEEQTPPPPPAYAAATEEDDEEEDKGAYYGLRENPRKSFLLADPEFSFAASVVLQDRESETESSKNPTRRRSKRTRKSAHLPHPNHTHTHAHAHYQFKPGRVESWVAEPEPVSSISDATTEEDVAFCLMMLSRDQWSSTRNHRHHHHQHQQQQQKQRRRVDSEELEELEYETQQQPEEAEEGEDDEEEETDGFESDEAVKTIKISKSGRGGKYKCETCNKVFRSYQALGGHRASHKKVKLCSSEPSRRQGPSSVNAATADEPRSHECPVCLRVFASGQALGGHKRSHLVHSSVAPPPAPPPPATPTATAATQSKSSGRCGDNLSLIDLNLPAPIDDDDLSQVELSAVSDADFVNSFRR